MEPTHFKNKLGYIVPTNKYLSAYYKELELTPIFEGKEDVPADELKALTVTELRAKCKAAGVTGYSKMTEDELIAALVEG